MAGRINPANPTKTRRGRSTADRAALSSAALLIALAALLGLAPAPTLAAPPGQPPPPPPASGFTVQETAHFVFFGQSSGQTDVVAFAGTYGPAAEQAFTELAALFNVQPPTKIAIYAYADDQSLQRAIQGIDAVELTRVGAIADPGSLSISLALPTFLARSPREAENAIRHATAHLLVGLAAGHNLPRGFEEGIAQYVERLPTPRLARIAATVQGANQRGALLSWSDLNRSQPPSADAELMRAESYAVVAFLLDQYTVRSFRDFLAALRTEPDWRLAMRATYNRSAGEIETQWKDNLPRWGAGGWKENLVAAFDLQPARDLLAGANYAAAKAALDRSQRLYADLGDRERLAEVEALLLQCDTGIQAEALMTQAQEALELHTYDRAQILLTQARTQYAQLPPEQHPTGLLEAYDRLAASGLQAINSLDRAQQLSRRWRDYPDARSAALGAGSTFAALGDEEMTARAQAVLHDLDVRQRRLVLLLAALACLTAAWLALWLWARGPAEVNWS